MNFDDYITIQKARLKWKVSADRVRQWIASGRIPGAVQFGEHKTAPWMIPKGARKPKKLKPGRKT